MKPGSEEVGSFSQPLSPGFWLAIGSGVALRLWYLSDLVQQPWFGQLLVDSLTFDRTAREILAQGHPAAFFRPPLYPYFLAAIYASVGRSFAAVALVQGLLGITALYPAYRLGERWFGRTAATAGTWIAACYPLRIFFEGEVLDVTLFAFLFAWGIWALWNGLERRATLTLLLSGLLFGAATLTRPNLVAALPFIAVGAALAFPAGLRRTLRAAAAWGLGLVLAIAPTTLHNWRAEGSFIPVAANGGVNFYLGNERGADGVTPVPPGLRWEATMLRPIREGYTSLAAQDRWWYARAREEIAAAPGRWLRLLSVKSAIFLGAAEPSNNKALGHFTAVSFPVRHYRWWYGALICLALAGCVARGGRRTAFLALVVAGSAASVVPFFVAERYRLPLVPLLAPAAAAGALALWGALRERAWGRLLPLAALTAAAALLVFPDWHGAGRERISADFQMGQIHLMRREPELALACLERARAADPGDPDVHNSLGAAHVQLGNLSAAEEAYGAALALGEYGEVWFNLGVVAERRGAAQRALAIERYRRALAVNPTAAVARANLEALESGGNAAEGAPAGGTNRTTPPRP